MTLSHRVPHYLAVPALAYSDEAIRIVAASAQNWPELASLNLGEIAVGDDGLIRLALWSASKCCATLLGTSRASLLLPKEGGTWEIRCFVMANANLATPRPLSGFLLKPFELLDGHMPRGAHTSRGGSSNRQEYLSRAGETRLALLEAFPVIPDWENAPRGGVHRP
jgi:hypothetical protein